MGENPEPDVDEGEVEQKPSRKKCYIFVAVAVLAVLAICAIAIQMFVPRMLICGILLTCTLLWFYRSGRDEITPAVVTDYLADDIMEKSAPDKDPFDKCILPNYDPWDEHVIPYVDQNYNPLKYCNHSFKPMTKLRKGIVTVNAKGVSCVGRCLTRSSDLSNNRSQWLDVTKTKYLCDIVETLCTNSKGKKVYQMVHAQVIEKKEPKSGKTKQKNEGYYNIYVILLDSVSATQGTRHLPQTLQFFEKSMQAVSFPYINKVGLNSRPNGVAMWFGKSMERVHRKLFHLPDIEPDWTFIEFCRRYVDNETFLMKEFSERGYKTLLAEDWMLGTLNYPYCKGFKKQPTDHYMRPFQIALEMNATKLLTDTYNYANCIEQHQDILGYLQDFVNSYKGIPKFGWIWLSLLSHNHESGVFHADHDFQQFLLRNKKKSLRSPVAYQISAIQSSWSCRS
ncbi:hypothetical protein Aduo_013806 [Ancylostoma duodenale]